MMKLDLQLFANGTIPGGNYNRIYSYYLNWSSIPNTTGNYSDVTVQWIYKKNASDPYNAFNTSGSSKVNITIDGTSSGNLNAPFDLRNASVGSAVIIASFSKRVYHADNGQKSVNISATHTTGNSWGTKTIASTSRPLDTIARATTCPNLSGYIEDTYTIALNPASSSFTHSLKVTLGSVTGFINASGNLQSTEYKFSNKNINFTLPISFYQQFGGKSGAGKLTLNTYNGNTLIGTKTATLTANCLESKCKPTITGTAVDVNSITTALTGNANKLVKGFSNVKITPTIKASSTSGDTRSTISTKSVDGTTFTTDTVTLNKVSKKDFTVTVTNSRGFSTSQVVSATGGILDYFAPNMNVSFARVNQTSSQVKLTYNGSFFNASFGSVSNALIVKWYWKKRNASSWTLGGSLTPSLNGNTINQSTIDCGSKFDYQTDYRFKLEVVDKLSNGNKEMDVVAGIPNFDFGKTWFQHHTDIYNKNNKKVIARDEVRTSNSVVSTNHGTNGTEIPCMDFLSYWDGSYSATSHNSKLRYSYQGEIQSKPKVLFNNGNGTVGEVALSESVVDYSYLEILYSKADVYNSVKIYSPNNKQVDLVISYLANASTLQVKAKVVKVATNKITNISERYLNAMTNGTISVSTSNLWEIRIHRVLGYK